MKTLITPRLYTFSRLLLVSIICVIFAPAPAFAKGDYTIEQEDDLFTLTAHDASLASLIDKLSEMTEIPMNIAERQDTQVTLSFSEYTLESLIAELPLSSMVIRRNIDGNDIISEVVFMLGSEGNDATAAALPTGEPNEGIIIEPRALVNKLDEIPGVNAQLQTKPAGALLRQQHSPPGQGRQNDQRL